MQAAAAGLRQRGQWTIHRTIRNTDWTDSGPAGEKIENSKPQTWSTGPRYIVANEGQNCRLTTIFTQHYSPLVSEDP